jgi:hypothetical protein
MGGIMLNRTKIVLVMLVIAMLVTTWGMLGTAVAQKAAVPKPQDKIAIGEDGVKRLLPLMDHDKDGKVSKQEFMGFMEAEFDRLDKKKEGKLDIKEQTQPPPPPIRGFHK